MSYQVSRNTTIHVRPTELHFGNEFSQQAHLNMDTAGRLTVRLQQDGKAIGVRFTAAEVQLIRDLIK